MIGQIGRIIRPLQSVHDEPILYAEEPASGFLFVPDQSERFLQRELRLGARPSVFRIIKEEHVVLAGFRSYITADGYFFNDTSVIPGFGYSDLFPKYARGQTEELGGELDTYGVTLTEERPVSEIDEPVICIGSDEPSNYGSWLYRILPKLISCSDRDRIAILTPKFAPWMDGLLGLFFGNLDYRPQAAKRRYILKEAYIPSLRNIGIYFDDVTLAFYRNVAERISGKSPHERIYLSRQASARKRPDGRVLQNEPELIAALEERGFVAIEMETLSIEDQVRIIRDARVIVAPGGAGLFNCVFATHAERVVDIEPNRVWLHPHHMLLRSSRLHHAIVLGDQKDQSAPHSTWTVDIPAVVRALS